MRRLLIVIWLLAISLCMPAQKILKRELHYVPTDSIAFLTADKTNLLVAAWATDSTAKLRQPIISRSEACKLLRKSSKDSFEKFPPTLSPQYYPFILAAQRIEKIASSLAWTGNAAFADVAESLLLNEILMGLGRKPVEHACAEALLQGALMTYMTDREGVFVNLFQDCFAHIVSDGLDLTLDQITDMPFSPRVKLRIGGIPSQTRLKLRLRKPAWQKEPLTLYVNGHETDIETVNGYIVIDRLWKSGDEVYVDFDLTPRIMPDMTIVSGALRFIPDNVPTEPISLGESTTTQGHPILQGEGFTAMPMMDL